MYGFWMAGLGSWIQKCYHLLYGQLVILWYICCTIEIVVVDESRTSGDNSRPKIDIHIGLCLKDFPVYIWFGLFRSPTILASLPSKSATMFTLVRQSARLTRVPYQLIATRALSDASGMPLTFSSPYDVCLEFYENIDW